MAPLKPALHTAFRTEYHFGDRVLTVSRGNPLPLGAHPMPTGVNFALACRHGTAVWLVLSEPCEATLLAEIPLDDLYNRTGDHWHVRVDGLPEEFCYGYRVDGPRGRRPSVRPQRDPARSRTRGPLVRPALGQRGNSAAPQPDRPNR